MLSWKVICENPNTQKIEYYDIFKSKLWVGVARELKEKYPIFQEWSDKFRTKLMSQYWARCEYEIVVTSWPPYLNVEDIDKLKQEVEDKEKQYSTKPYRVNINPTVARKLDVFEQIDANWGVFSQYVWRNI